MYAGRQLRRGKMSVNTVSSIKANDTYTSNQSNNDSELSRLQKQRAQLQKELAEINASDDDVETKETKAQQIQLQIQQIDMQIQQLKSEEKSEKAEKKDAVVTQPLETNNKKEDENLGQNVDVYI